MSDELGRMIHLRRAAMGMSQGEAATLVGVARPMLSRWENGRSVPSVRSLERLAGVLQVPLEHLESMIPARPRQPSRRRRLTRCRPKRPPYPVAATLQQMLRAGGCAGQIYQQVRQRLSDEDLRVVEAEFPRDTRHELLAIFHLLLGRTRLVECTLERLSCPLLVLDDFERVAGASQRQHALLWEGDGERMVVFGQVRVRAAGSIPYRLDFLIWYKRAGCPGHWVSLEIDGGQHRQMPNVDASRAEGIGIPEIRHDNAQTLSPWYFQRLLEDVRKKAALAAEWRRDRKRRARMERCRRMQEAAERRMAA